MKAASLAPIRPFALRGGAVRTFTRSAIARNASQPAPPASSASTSNPHAARVAAAAAPAPGSSGGDARSRLAKLQAQRLEELNRGRTSGGAAGGRPNKPEQKWSNRTLIALATSVGACTYLMGTYHGYNAGKAHVEEHIQLQAAGTTDVLPNITVPPLAKPSTAPAAALPSSSMLAASLLQLLPSTLGSAIQCEPQPKPDCRLAELTQYHCDLHTNRVVCQPIDRIFRLCKGRPAVEVSHIVEFDEAGKPYLPDHLSEAMPPSSHWHELRSPDL
ncbi:conserved hypothetical protein [Sporisorium reilianum SRZ2]|uniref:Uncharacterized protein n=1 Tax=Sporisorium reilianum (strain SRZ2) TaxID=999809 RepID=E6ZUY5_SPORE|nr:conserved hypothetical protein [Sporisorium reilianum SRZ2]